MSELPRTTLDKALDIIGADKLKEIAKAGLLIIDRQDFEEAMAYYNRSADEIKSLNLQLKKQEQAHREELQRLKDQRTLGL